MISSNRRSESEIIGQMLSLAREDVKKTRLMHQTNLCYNYFIKYMNFLLNNGFLGVKTDNPSGKVYYTTEKGEKILKGIKNVHDQVD